MSYCPACPLVAKRRSPHAVGGEPYSFGPATGDPFFNPQSTILPSIALAKEGGNRQLTPCVIQALFPRLPAGFTHCPINVCGRSLALEALLFCLRLQFAFQCLWHFDLHFLPLFAVNQIAIRHLSASQFGGKHLTLKTKN